MKKYCSILGVHISVLDITQLTDYVVNNLNIIKGKYICVSNVHTTVMSFENKNYLSVQNNALFVLPDGGPLASEGRRRGYKDMTRIVGQDYMREIFKKGYRHYFYGSTEDTLKKMIDNIKKEYPTIDVVGSYSPPFRELTKDEDTKIIDMINDTKPDFVWVGLGAPKQEIWMYNHQNKINGLMVGVGAAFDYFAGNIKRAPKWMQNCNLEWFYRLLQDPKRLFKRYLTTNIKFIINATIKGK